MKKSYFKAQKMQNLLVSQNKIPQFYSMTIHPLFSFGQKTDNSNK